MKEESEEIEFHPSRIVTLCLSLLVFTFMCLFSTLLVYLSTRNVLLAGICFLITSVLSIFIISKMAKPKLTLSQKGIFYRDKFYDWNEIVSMSRNVDEGIYYRVKTKNGDVITFNGIFFSTQFEKLVVANASFEEVPVGKYFYFKRWKKIGGEYEYTGFWDKLVDILQKKIF